MKQAEIYSWKIDQGQFATSENNSNINISGSEKIMAILLPWKDC